jgi:hypothetical protein
VGRPPALDDERKGHIAMTQSTDLPRHHHQVDDAVLSKVRGLLAKAESTTFEAEAEALTAKAQELMAKYAIDQALLDRPGTGSAGPETEVIHIADPYASAKSILLHQVANANRCRAVWSQRSGDATVFGFAVDLAAVELLYTSLLVQATTAMVAAGPQRDRRGKVTTRSFRRAFLLSFAHRIGQRLRETTAATVREAAVEHGADLLPVLASREELVEQAMVKAFPTLGTRRLSVTNADGWAAGRHAADAASLRPAPAVGRGR